jgi:hypothetical protein
MADQPAAPAPTQTQLPLDNSAADIVRLQAENALLHKTLEEHQSKLAGLSEAAQKIASYEQRMNSYQDFARAQLKAKHESAPDWVKEKYALADDKDPLEQMVGLDTATQFYAEMEAKIMEKYKAQNAPADPTKAAKVQPSGRPDMTTHEGMLAFINSLNGGNK